MPWHKPARFNFGGSSGFVRSVPSSACVRYPELATLLGFRQELYDSLGLRQDSLFELVDTVLTAPQLNTLVRLSLV
jgi:hypothetical protein